LKNIKWVLLLGRRGPTPISSIKFQLFVGFSCPEEGSFSNLSGSTYKSPHSLSSVLYIFVPLSRQDQDSGNRPAGVHGGGLRGGGEAVQAVQEEERRQGRRPQRQGRQEQVLLRAMRTARQGAARAVLHHATLRHHVGLLARAVRMMMRHGWSWSSGSLRSRSSIASFRNRELCKKKLFNLFFPFLLY
jgi:hypothetical protein